MPDSWQRALYIPLIVLAWLAIVLLGGWLLTHVAKTLLTLLLSGITAFALTPLVSVLARWLPRGLAIAVAYVLGFVVAEVTSDAPGVDDPTVGPAEVRPGVLVPRIEAEPAKDGDRRGGLRVALHGDLGGRPPRRRL